MSMLRVLIADPDPVSRARSVSFLHRDHTIKVVGEAQDGLEVYLLSEFLRPDVIVTEITMPFMNGYEVATRLKSRSPRTKVVFLTLHEEETYRELADLLGVDGFVRKEALDAEFPAVFKNIHKHMPHFVRQYSFTSGYPVHKEGPFPHPHVRHGRSWGGE